MTALETRKNIERTKRAERMEKIKKDLRGRCNSVIIMSNVKPERAFVPALKSRAWAQSKGQNLNFSL